MKYIIKVIMTLAVALSISSCATKLNVGDLEGELSDIKLSVETNSTLNTISVSSKTMGADPTYSLSVINSKDEVVKTYDDCSMAGDLKLSSGVYTFVIESGSDGEPALDTPHYYGEQKVTVVAGTENLVSITAKLKNTRVSADFSAVIKDNSLFTDYSFSISEARLTATDIERGSSIYFTPEQGAMEFVVSVTNTQGTTSSIRRRIYDVVTCSHYKFFFDVDMSANENDGSLSLELIINSTLIVISDTIDINLEKRAAPILTTVGYTSGEQKIIKVDDRTTATAQLDMDVTAGTDEIMLRHTSTYLFDNGMPYSVNLSTASAELRATIKSIGIEWSSYIDGNKNPLINFTKLGELAPLGDYKLYVTLHDKDYQFSESVYHFVIMPPQDHFALSIECGAKYAIFYGEWCTWDQPSGLSFEYRIKDAQTWTIADPNSVEVTDVDGKLYKVRVKGLQPLTDYEVRSYTPAFTYPDDAIWLSFTTADAPEVPNLNFESGYSSGKTWYPNASGGNSFWATGNEGVNMFPVSRTSNTHHTDDAVSGKAIKMFTYTGIMVVDVAAGNLYTGIYKTNMGDPIQSAKNGRPYTGRPLGLKGWYKYTPAGQDECHIYMVLEDWNGATTRPGNPTQIAYGEFKTGSKIDAYTQFEFTLDYKSDKKPTHISIVATSSIGGANFVGWDGSTLFIDEFELIWD